MAIWAAYVRVGPHFISPWGCWPIYIYIFKSQSPTVVRVSERMLDNLSTFGHVVSSVVLSPLVKPNRFLTLCKSSGPTVDERRSGQLMPPQLLGMTETSSRSHDSATLPMSRDITTTQGELPLDGQHLG